MLGAGVHLWGIRTTLLIGSASATCWKGYTAPRMPASHLHHFLRSEVVIDLGPIAAPHLRWGRSRLPTLLDIEPLRASASDIGFDVDFL